MIGTLMVLVGFSDEDVAEAAAKVRSITDFLAAMAAADVVERM